MPEEKDIFRRRPRVGYVLETRDWEVRPTYEKFDSIPTSSLLIIAWFHTVYLIRSGLRTVHSWLGQVITCSSMANANPRTIFLRSRTPIPNRQNKETYSNTLPGRMGHWNSTIHRCCYSAYFGVRRRTFSPTSGPVLMLHLGRSFRQSRVGQGNHRRTCQAP